MSSSQASPTDQTNNSQTYNYSRRASFSPGTTLSDFFTSNRTPATTPAYPGPITSAAAQASHRRRMSVSSATGTSPPHLQTGFSLRRGSVSSVSSTTSAVDEIAIEEDDVSPSVGNSPFGRRMSFGARALRDVKIPSRRADALSAGPVSPTVPRTFWPETGKATSPEKTETHHRRRQSMSMMPQPVNSMSPKDISVDPLQERMLKGDFYMD